MDSKKFSPKLKNKEYRDSFVGAEIDFALPAQVRALRNKRGWTQAELADKAGMKQARISAIEGAKKGSLNLATLQRLASAFDVALLVKFAKFSEFAEWVATFSQDTFAVLSFDEDARLQAEQPIATAQPRSEAKQPVITLKVASSLNDSWQWFLCNQGPAAINEDAIVFDCLNYTNIHEPMSAPNDARIHLAIQKEHPRV
jgi:transcriptional regulator with XRE-family HTH domain